MWVQSTKKRIEITLQRKKKQIKGHCWWNLYLNDINCKLKTAIKQFLREIHQKFCVTLPTIMLTRHTQTLEISVYCRSTHPSAFLCLAFWCTTTRMLQEIQQPSCDKSQLILPVLKMYMLPSSTSAASVRVTYLSVCACKKDTFGIRRGKIFAPMIRHKRNSRKSGFRRNYKL